MRDFTKDPGRAPKRLLQLVCTVTKTRTFQFPKKISNGKQV